MDLRQEFRLGASIAFYTLLSLAPLLVIVGVAALFFGKEAAQGQLFCRSKTSWAEVARAIQGVLQNAYKPRTGIFATVLGLLTLAFGASSFVVELHDVLNVVWKAPVPSSGTGLRSIIALAKERFHALAIVLGAGFLLLVSLVLNPSLTAAAKVLKSSLSIPGSLLQVMNFLLSFLVIAGLFAVIYRVLPEGDFARPNEEHGRQVQRFGESPARRTSEQNRTNRVPVPLAFKSASKGNVLIP